MIAGHRNESHYEPDGNLHEKFLMELVSTSCKGKQYSDIRIAEVGKRRQKIKLSLSAREKV